MVVDGDGIFGWLRKLFTPPDLEKELQDALAVLYSADKWCKTVVDTVSDKGITVKFQAGELKNSTLATTEITNSTATVTVDIGKVHRAHDNLIPVLAHEIFHISQAHLDRGVDSFCSIVQRDKNLPWDQRELEIGAVTYEDTLRASLLKNPYWKGKMAPTRREAQLIAARFGYMH